jgi:hypothetical protein
MARLKKFTLVTVALLSLTLNAAVIFLGLVWLAGRMDPIVVTPKEMVRVIRGFSWNSAGKWRVIEHDDRRIIVEYKLPVYDIYRYELPAEYFELSEEHKKDNRPFWLSFEGCEISVRADRGHKFQCLKFRDLSSKDGL